jgi:hypothetical protein
MPKRDINQIAFDVVQKATGRAVTPVPSVKAVSERKGGLTGGARRAAVLTPEQRRQIAQKAAGTRWRKKYK